ncbi:C40 family peptidase [Sulfitobacter sp. JB4-11]|uniref:C40 family peptidase n=1 Tax=Sulfitobacter rhodophyticola TaxID=3238304 RepID=UPI003516EE3F
MSDPRLTPDPALCTQQDPAQIKVALADLCRGPGGPRDRQLIHGDGVTVLHQSVGWSYVQSLKDGYVGHLHTDALGPLTTLTHRVTAAASHAYEAPDLKSPDRIALTFGSSLEVTSRTDHFAETALGYVPLPHLGPMDQTATDPASIAAVFLGTPYLWGGNSRWGIDCSGLVQAALLACGIPCPGDSDMQQSLGTPATGPFKRNDLIFWKGHVAIVSDAETIIHANAATMSTNYEPIETAKTRILSQGDGPITAHRRL